MGGIGRSVALGAFLRYPHRCLVPEYHWDTTRVELSRHEWQYIILGRHLSRAIKSHRQGA